MPHKGSRERQTNWTVWMPSGIFSAMSPLLLPVRAAEVIPPLLVICQDACDPGRSLAKEPEAQGLQWDYLNYPNYPGLPEQGRDRR